MISGSSRRRVCYLIVKPTSLLVRLRMSILEFKGSRGVEELVCGPAEQTEQTEQTNFDVVGRNVNTRMQLLLFLVVAAQSLLLVHCF